MTVHPGLRLPAVLLALVLLAIAFGASGCTRAENVNRIVIWHQMRVDEREILQAQIEGFMKANPGIVVEQMYKETEELRSGFIVAAIAGQGPDLVYGPSDQIGPFEVMGIIEPLEGLFDSAFLGSFIPQGLTYYHNHLYQIADKLGNHLTLIYNKDMVQQPPETDEDLIALGMKLTVDRNGDGKPEVYGLSWNYTEPFFFIPFMTGFGGWVMTDDGRPTLDNQGTIDGLNFIRDLRDKYHIIPAESDYNIADMLFKDGKSAMIINGDWSWAGYRKAGVNFGVAPLPRISRTGLWCAPMISPKGYSINANVRDAKRELVVRLLRFLMEPSVQLETARALNTMPTRREAVQSEFVQEDDILRNSAMQIERGRPMPVVPELRAIWDAMRPSYQAVLGGAKTPRQAARDMQALALRKIAEMNE
jgi:arabinogalactan oligomer/maltooligosaccharide transport system permease protein